MALLALSKGQLLISIYKMCKENDMKSLYDKKLLKYDIPQLASEYVDIENKITEKNKREKMYYDDSDDSDDCDDYFMKNATMKNPNFMKEETIENPNCCY